MTLSDHPKGMVALLLTMIVIMGCMHYTLRLVVAVIGHQTVLCVVLTVIGGQVVGVGSPDVESAD
jgi:hypothetical protein